MNESHYDFIPPSPLRRRAKRLALIATALTIIFIAFFLIYLPKVAGWALLVGIVATIAYTYIVWRDDIWKGL